MAFQRFKNRKKIISLEFTKSLMNRTLKKSSSISKGPQAVEGSESVAAAYSQSNHDQAGPSKVCNNSASDNTLTNLQLYLHSCTSGTWFLSSNLVLLRVRPKNLKIEKVAEQCQPYPSNGHRTKIINDLIMHLVMQDRQPLSNVENRGFRAFVKDLVKLYNFHQELRWLTGFCLNGTNKSRKI